MDQKRRDFMYGAGLATVFGSTLLLSEMAGPTEATASSGGYEQFVTASPQPPSEPQRFESHGDLRHPWAQ